MEKRPVVIEGTFKVVVRRFQTEMQKEKKNFLIFQKKLSFFFNIIHIFPFWYFFSFYKFFKIIIFFFFFIIIFFLFFLIKIKKKKIYFFFF